MYRCEGRLLRVKLQEIVKRVKKKKRRRKKKENGTKIVCELLGRLRLYTLRREIGMEIRKRLTLSLSRRLYTYLCTFAIQSRCATLCLLTKYHKLLGLLIKQ